MRLREIKALAFAFMGLIIVMGSIGSKEERQEGKWIKWGGVEADFSKEKGYTRSYGSYFEASASGRYVVQVWIGVQVVKGKPRHERYEIEIEGMAASEPQIAVIWEVGKDGKLLRRVWSSEGKDLFVVNVEWVKDELVLLILPGVRDWEEVGMFGKCGHYKKVRVVRINPETGEESNFTKVPSVYLVANPSGDRVLLCEVDYNWEAEKTQMHFSIHSFPDGGRVSGFTHSSDYLLQKFGFGLSEVILSIAGRTGGYVVGWADGEHIWVIGEQEGPRMPFTGGSPAPVPILFGIDKKGKIERLSGDPKRGEWALEGHGAAGFSIHDKAGGLIFYTMIPQILDDGRLAIMLGEKPKLAFFSFKHLRKEYLFEPERYPETLKRIVKERQAKTDQEQCVRVLAITPDGRRLILQEGGIIQPALDTSRPLWVWAWDLETNEMQKLAETGYIESRKVFGWLRKEYLIVQANRDLGDKLIREYGVIHVPSK